MNWSIPGQNLNVGVVNLITPDSLIAGFNIEDLLIVLNYTIDDLEMLDDIGFVPDPTIMSFRNNLSVTPGFGIFI